MKSKANGINVIKFIDNMTVTNLLEICLKKLIVIKKLNNVINIEYIA